MNGTNKKGYKQKKAVAQAQKAPEPKLTNGLSASSPKQRKKHKIYIKFYLIIYINKTQWK